MSLFQNKSSGSKNFNIVQLRVSGVSIDWCSHSSRNSQKISKNYYYHCFFSLLFAVWNS